MELDVRRFEDAYHRDHLCIADFIFCGELFVDSLFVLSSYPSYLSLVLIWITIVVQEPVNIGDATCLVTTLRG